MDRNNTVKVADFGLTRDVYQKDYYRQNSRGQVPVKWMAPESLLDHISNEKTDVVYIQKWKNHSYEMKRDVGIGMPCHENEGEQEDA